MKIVSHLMLFACLSTVPAAYSQAANESALSAAQAFSSSMDGDLSFVEQEVMTAARTMPADPYNFSPWPWICLEPSSMEFAPLRIR